MADSPEWVVLPEHLEEDDDEQSDHSNNSSDDNDDDEDDEILIPPPPSSSGDNPAMVTQRPSSRSRHSTPTAADALLHRTTTTTPTGSRSATPLSYEALSNRPRSNPRVRTPMRYESPLTSTAFHRSSVQQEEDESDERVEGQRLTIRMNAGLPVGTVSSLRQNTPTTTSTTTTTAPQTYRHQVQPRYHSQRKMRRWNNDKMMGISSDLAKYAKRNSYNAAEIFTRGEADAYKYRVANYPLEYKSEFARLVTSNETDDLKLIQVREKFIRGEVAEGNTTSSKSSTKDKKKRKEIYSDGNKMYQQVNVRLRNVLSRALSSKSRNADSVICAFESFLTSLKAHETMSVDDDTDSENRRGDEQKTEHEAILQEVLLRQPSISWKTSTHRHTKHTDDDKEKEGTHQHHKKSLMAQFVFDAKSSQGGFHRLLLHAVCQFHGLNSNSSSTSVAEGGGRSNNSCKARVLTVTGRCRGRKFRLVDYASEQHDEAKSVLKKEVSLVAPGQPCSRESSVESQCGGNSVMSEGVLVGHMSALDVS